MVARAAVEDDLKQMEQRLAQAHSQMEGFMGKQQQLGDELHEVSNTAATHC